MKWEKLGQVFCPQEVNDGIQREWMKEYAQCTSAIVFDNFIRVYFSCRPYKDKDDQATSYATFVDLEKQEPFKVVQVAKKPILSLGDLGTFDEFAIYPISVIRNENKFLLYYAGWTRYKSVPFNTAIGIAESCDGENFHRIGDGPILSSSLYEPFVISGPKVRKYNNKWFMFYLAGNKWIRYEGRQEVVYKLRMATSEDGLNWSKLNKNIVSNILEENECQAGPDVFFFDNKYHMYFVYRYALDFRNNSRGYRIGYATSQNLYDWERKDNEVGIKYSDSGWDSQMHHYPHIFQLNNLYYMIYNGNDFGKYGFGIARMCDAGNEV